MDLSKLRCREKPHGKHHWKDGWICEWCGLRKADYEEMKKFNTRQINNATKKEPTP